MLTMIIHTDLFQSDHSWACRTPRTLSVQPLHCACCMILYYHQQDSKYNASAQKTGIKISNTFCVYGFLNNGQMNSMGAINASCLTKGHTSSRLTFISSPFFRGIYTSVSDIPLFFLFLFFFIEKSQIKQVLLLFIRRAGQRQSV